MARPSARFRNDEATVAKFEALPILPGFVACACHARTFAWEPWQRKPSITSQRRG